MPTTSKKNMKKQLRDRKGRFAEHVVADAQEELSADTGISVETAASALWGLLNGSGPEEQDTSQEINKQRPGGEPISDSDSSDDSSSEEDNNFDSADEGGAEIDSGASGLAASAVSVDPIDITLQLVSQLRAGTTSGDDLELFINAVDMYRFDKPLVKLVTARPRALTVLLPALQAKDPKLKQLVNDLSDFISANVTGKQLARHMIKFVADFTTLHRAQPPATILGLLVVAGKFRTKKYKQENLAAFHFSRKVLRFVRHYCSVPDSKINKFVRAASKGNLYGNNLPVLNSHGYARMQETDPVKLTWHLHNLLEALNAYISYEAVKIMSAEKATLKLEIDGPNHELSMTENETAEQYQEKWEDAVEETLEICKLEDEEDLMPSKKKMLSYIKNGCSRKLWTAVNHRLTRDSILWKSMSYDAAWKCMELAQSDIQIADENRKDFTQYHGKADDLKKDKKSKKDKKDKRQRSEDGSAALDGAQAENTSAPAAPAGPATARSAEAQWNGTPLSECLPGSINRECIHHKTDRGCDRGDKCPFKHSDRALQQQQEAEKSRKAHTKPEDEVPKTGFKGLAVPKERTVRFNSVLIRETQHSFSCDIGALVEPRAALMSTLRDGSVVLDCVVQNTHIGITDVMVQASMFIEIIAEVVRADVIGSVIEAGNALADYVEANGYYDAAAGGQLVQECLMRALTKEEQCRLSSAVDHYLEKQCEKRRVQVRSQIDSTCNWVGEPRYDNMMLLEALADSRGTERSTDEDIDGVPSDHVSYLHRVSGGVLGAADDVTDERSVEARPGSYMYGDYAVLGSTIDINLLADHGVEELANSDNSGVSTDLGSDELSDDETESVAELNILRSSMRAAANREDYVMAAELQSKVNQMRRGLVKLAQKKGLSTQDVKLMQSHQRMRQQTIQDTQYQMLCVVVLSQSNMTLVKVTDSGICLPTMKIRLDRGASDWNRCAKRVAEELGVSFLHAIKLDGAGIGFIVVSTADMTDVKSHAWLSAGQVRDSDLTARHKEYVHAAVDATGQTTVPVGSSVSTEPVGSLVSTAGAVTRFNGVLITEKTESADDDEKHVWSRTDRGAGAYKGLITTDCAAPEWHMVTRRVTTDITTGELLDDISVSDPLWFVASHMMRSLPQCRTKRRDIMTVFEYESDSDSDSSSSSDSSDEKDLTPGVHADCEQGIPCVPTVSSPIWGHIKQLAEQAGLTGTVRELSGSAITDLLESEEARKGLKAHSGSAVTSMCDSELQRAIHDTVHMPNEQVLDGVVGWVAGVRGLISFDNYATAGVIDMSVDVSEMQMVVKHDNSFIGGFGGTGVVPAGPLYKVEISLRFGVSHGYVLVRRGDLSGTSKGLCLVNKICQRRMGVNILSENDEIHVTTHASEIAVPSKDVLFAEPNAVILSRLVSRGLTVVSFCDGGMASLYIELIQMGYNVKRYIAVENDPECRELADAICPVMDRCLGDDITLVTLEDLDAIDEVDVIVATPECQSFSGRQENARGFEDMSGTKTFVSSAACFRHLCSSFPSARAMFENTQVSGKNGDVWKTEQERLQEELLGGRKMTDRQATDYGSAHSRNRRIYCNLTDWKTRVRSSAAHRMFKNWFPLRDPTWCIVASMETNDPVWVKNSQGTERKMHINEGERMFGYGTGVTTAFGTVTISEEKRWKVLGNGVCSSHFHAAMQGLGTQAAPVRVVASNILEKHPDQLELHLMNLTESERRQWIRDQRNGWNPPELDFEIRGEKYHCMRPFPVPPKNEDAVMAKCKHMNAVQDMMDWEDPSKFDPDSCYSPAFWPMKNNADGSPRISPDTGMQDCRLLCALQVVNSLTIQEMEKWWAEYTPDLQRFRETFGPEDKYKVVVDEADAFHWCEVSEKSQKYLKVVFLIKKVLKVMRLKRAPQGFVLSAQFYCYRKHLTLVRIIGWAVLVWYSIYMDDNVAKSPTEERTRFRAEFLVMILDEFNMKVSPKNLPLPPPALEVKAAGNTLGEKGFCCDDTMLETIKAACTKKVAGKVQAQSVIGILQQTHTGVDWAIGNLSRFANNMHAMIQCVKTVPFKWTQSAKHAQEDILEMAEIGGLPRAYCHPDYLVSAESCLIFGGDASDLGTGEAMWRVMIPDARHVNVPDDLCDPSIAMLVDCMYSVLSDAEQKWLTFENEMNKIRNILVRKSGLLISSMQGFTCDRDSPDYVCKGLVYTDSTFALGTAEQVTIPTGKVEFATAKARKLAGWAEDLAFTRSLPIEFAGIPGVYNHLPDFLSHLSDALASFDRTARQDEAAASMKVHLNCAVTRHSYHESRSTEVTAAQFDEPEGWNIFYMNLDDEQWHTVCDAYRSDKSEFNKVPMCDIYASLVDAGKDVQLMQLERVHSWKQKIFAVSVCKDGTPALFIPSSFVRVVGDNDELPGLPDRLVLWPPKGAQVFVSTAQKLFDDEAGCDHFTDTDLRSDMCLLSHDYSLHAAWPEMVRFIKKSAAWMTMIADVKAHIASCPLCISKLRSQRLAGFGLISVATYRHVGCDHIILTKKLAELTGMAGILTIGCRASGEIEAVLVQDTSAIVSALAIFNRWIRNRGLMRVMYTDNAFDTAVFGIMLDLFGVRVHNLTHIGDSQGLGGIESLNNVAQQVILEAESKGDIACAADLDVMLTKGVMKHNMITETAGSTVFERTHGCKARTVGDALTVLPDLHKEISELSGKNAADEARVIALLRQQTESMMLAYREAVDERSRRTAFDRDQRVTHTSVCEFDLRRNDEVSYCNTSGNQLIGTLMNITAYSGDVPIHAEVKLANGEIKKVKYSSLRPVGTPRSQLMVTDVTERPDIGKLVLFQTDIYGPQRIAGGIITAVSGADLEVHVHAASDSARSWMPSWSKTGRKPKSCKTNPGSGFTAYLVLVAIADVEMYGTLLYPSYLVNEDTIEKMKSKNII